MANKMAANRGQTTGRRLRRKTPAEVAAAIEDNSPVTEAEFAEFKAEILRLLKKAGIDPAGEGVWPADDADE